MKPLLRLRVPLGFAFAAAYLFYAKPSSWNRWFWCAGVVAVGCAVRSWAAGYLFKGKRVAVGGPYARVRNPLYLGSFIIGLGFLSILWQPALVGPGLALTAAFLAAYAVVYPAKIRSEELELAAALGDDYRIYSSRVPRFLPSFGAFRRLGPQRFSAELYRRNREWQCLAGSAAVLAFLAVRYARPF